MGIDGFTLSKSDVTREIILSQPRLTEDKQNELSSSDIIILPGREGYNPNGAFRDETIRFFKLAKKEFGEGKVSIAANQEDIRIEELRSGELWIPIVFIGQVIQAIGIEVVAQAIVGIVEHIAEGINESTKCHFEAIFDNGPGTKADRVKYDGPVRGLKKLPKIINELKSK